MKEFVFVLALLGMAAGCGVLLALMALGFRLTPFNRKPQIVNRKSPPLPEADVRQALTVGDSEPWWRAVHQVIDEVEREGNRGAREQVANDRLCVNSLGIADGAKLVRDRLVEIREEAIAARRAGG